MIDLSPSPHFHTPTRDFWYTICFIKFELLNNAVTCLSKVSEVTSMNGVISVIPALLTSRSMLPRDFTIDWVLCQSIRSTHAGRMSGHYKHKEKTSIRSTQAGRMSGHYKHKEKTSIRSTQAGRMSGHYKHKEKTSIRSTQAGRMSGHYKHKKTSIRSTQAGRMSGHYKHKEKTSIRSTQAGRMSGHYR